MTSTWRLVFAVGCVALAAACGGDSAAGDAGVAPGSDAARKPTVTITQPADGATVSGTVDVAATAAGGSGIVSVQLTLDGTNLGSPDTSAPYGASFDSTIYANGKHELGAVAVDASNVSSAPATVTIDVENTQTLSANLITVDASKKHQTITDWEATDYAGQDSPSFPQFVDALLQAAADLGISRVRQEIRSGVENTVDYYAEYKANQISASTWSTVQYQAVNDDADPFTINPNGFHFTQLDDVVSQIDIPLRTKVAAKGEKLHIDVTYIGKGSTQSYIVGDAEEYAEFVEATVKHLDQKFGIVPDTWEVELEPNIFAPAYWTNGTILGDAIVAASKRLKGDGYSGVTFIAPSNSATNLAVSYFNQLASNVPAALPSMSELSFHQYGFTTTDLQTLGTLGAKYGLHTAMLEHISADEQELYEDLTIANTSTWQQYCIGGPGGAITGGSSYFSVDLTNPNKPIIVPRSRTYALRQYIHYVRPGAVRIDATSNNASYQSTAFVNANGKYVAVVNVEATGGGSFSVEGLPAGTYEISWGSATLLQNMVVGTKTIASGQAITADIPAVGVVTVAQQ